MVSHRLFLLVYLFLFSILECDNRALLQVQLNELVDRDLIQLVPLEGKHVGQFGFRRKIHLQNHGQYTDSEYYRYSLSTNYLFIKDYFASFT